MPSSVADRPPPAAFGGPKEVAWTALSKQGRYRAEDFCRLGIRGFPIRLRSLVHSSWLIMRGSMFSGGCCRRNPSLRRLVDVALRAICASILSGGVLLLFILFLNGAYENRTLLRFRRFFFLLFKSLLVWLIAFSGISLILEFDERLSRVYVVISFGLLLVFLAISRFAVQRAILRTGVTAALRQRILFVDWTDKTSKIAEAALRDRWNPYELVGCAPNTKNRFTCQPPAEIPALGSYEEVSTLCEKGLIDIVILADGRRSEEDVIALARECEKAMVDFMVIPSGFQILLSGLELTTISGVPRPRSDKAPAQQSRQLGA